MLDLSPTSAVKEAARAEHRRWQRLPITIPVFVRGTDTNGKEFIEFVSALNISAGGMLIAARRLFPSLTGLTLEIPSAPLPPSQPSLRSTRSFRAKVVRTRVANQCHYVAFKFSRPLSLGERFD
jgi:hypothetical protein